jgi:hypothetical protein
MKTYTSHSQLRSFYRLLDQLNQCSYISTESKTMTQRAVALIQAKCYHQVADIEQGFMSDYPNTVNAENAYKYPMTQVIRARILLSNQREKMGPQLEAIEKYQSPHADYMSLFTLATAYIYATGEKIDITDLDSISELASKFLNNKSLQDDLLKVSEGGKPGLKQEELATIKNLYSAAMGIVKEMNDELGDSSDDKIKIQV